MYNVILVCFYRVLIYKVCFWILYFWVYFYSTIKIFFLRVSYLFGDLVYYLNYLETVNDHYSKRIRLKYNI